MLMCLEIEQICIIIGNLTMYSIRREILFSVDYYYCYHILLFAKVVVVV